MYYVRTTVHEWCVYAHMFIHVRLHVGTCRQRVDHSSVRADNVRPTDTVPHPTDTPTVSVDKCMIVIARVCVLVCACVCLYACHYFCVFVFHVSFWFCVCACAYMPIRDCEQCLLLSVRILNALFACSCPHPNPQPLPHPRPHLAYGHVIFVYGHAIPLSMGTPSPCLWPRHLCLWPRHPLVHGHAIIAYDHAIPLPMATPALPMTTQSPCP